MKVDLIVPNSLKEITLKQYQKFIKIQKENDDPYFLQCKMIEIFCNLDSNAVRNIKLSDADKIVNVLNLMFEEKPKLINTFKLGKIGYIGPSFLSFLTLYGLMTIAAFLFFITLPKGGKRIKVELYIFVVALLCRVAVFPLLPSDDMNRYMWEGKMLNQDINPYELAPDSSKLVGLRDDIWEGINHPDMTAAYPPGILFLFSQLNKISYNENLFKAVFCFFDLATLIIVFAFR